LKHEPKPELPKKLEGASALTIDTDELHAALRGVKAGAAPGLTGWTKELVLGLHATAILSEVLRDIINAIINDVTGEMGALMLTAPGIAFMQDTKIRTCGMRDFFVKVAWRAATTHTSLDALFTTSQTMGRRNGSLQAARWVQQQLDDGRGMVLGDAVNAHPSFDRAAAGRVLSDAKLTSLYSIFNFTYCNETPLRSYGRDGEQEFEVAIVVGQLQGCPSAGKMFCALEGSLMSARVPHLLPKVRLIMDDCAVAGMTSLEAEQNFSALADALVVGGINIRGPKKKVIEVASDKLFVFGGAAVARAGVVFPRLEEVKPLKRTKNRIELITTTGLAHQDILLLARHTSMALRYFLAATTPRIAQHYAKELQQMVVRPISTVVQSDVLPIHSLRQIFTPLASGGMGYVDPCMAREVYDDADNTVAAVGDDDQTGSSYEAKALESWRRVDSRGHHWWAAVEMFDTKRSWLSVFPTSKSLVLHDYAIELALKLYLNVGQVRATCVNAKETRTSPNVQSVDHWIQCAFCAGPWRKHRHNDGLAALFSTAQQFHVAMQADVAALLGNVLEEVEADVDSATDGAEDSELQETKKRPDGYVILPKIGDQAGGATTVMFDFTVTHVASLVKHAGTHPITRARYLKVRKYAKLLRGVKLMIDDGDDDGTHGAADTARVDVSLAPEVVPIVMTAIGFVDRSTSMFLERVGRIASRPGFAAAAIAAMQVRTLNAQASGVASVGWRLEAKKHAGVQINISGATVESQTGHEQGVFVVGGGV
jgi:hypothetical protein